MVDCPVCGTAGVPEGTACDVCGLPAIFFSSLQPGLSETSPVATVRTEDQSRPPPTDPPTVDESTGVRSRPEVSPAGLDVMAKRTVGLTDELLEVGTSLGLEVASLESSLEVAHAQGNAFDAWKVRRESIPIIVGGLLERYREICSRRDALSPRSATSKVDAALAGFRTALREGQLGRADQYRQVAERELNGIEATWTRIQARVSETSQIIRELKELGGVAPAVLRQVTEALRLDGRPEPGPIEEQLVRANAILWHLLVPRISHELSRSRALLHEATVSPANAELIRTEIGRLEDQLRSRKLTEALETSKWLRIELVSASRPGARSASRRSFLQ